MTLWTVVKESRYLLILRKNIVPDRKAEIYIIKLY